MTYEGDFPQSFAASPDVQISFLELVIQLSDDQNFYHRYIYLCIHHLAAINPNQQL